MASDALKILAGVGAGGAAGTSLAWVGTTSATAPTNATGALNTFHDVGYCDASGVSLSDAVSQNPIQAFGTTVPVRILTTSETQTFKFNVLESSTYAIELFYRKAVGSIVPSTGSFTVDRNANQARQLYSMVFDMVDGTNHLRIYLPVVEVTDLDDLTITAGQPVTYGMTLTAYPNAAGLVTRSFYTVADDVS